MSARRSCLLLITGVAILGLGVGEARAQITPADRQEGIRRMDEWKGLEIRPREGETIAGGRQRQAVFLERRFEQVSLVSDGSSWIILDGPD